MLLSELSAKYNVPVGYVKEFFDRHKILTLPYARLNPKAIKLFEDNLEIIKKNIKVEKLPRPRILGKAQLPVENYKYKSKPRRDFKSTGQSLSSYEEFKPLLSIGKLHYFDLTKNLVIINDVKNSKGFDPPRVDVSFIEMIRNRSLLENDIVAFTLYKESKGFIAKSLKKLSEIKFSEIDLFLEFISAKDLVKVEGFPTDNKWQIMDDETKKKFINFFLNKSEQEAWYYLSKIANEAEISLYLNHHLKILNDTEKVSYLQKSFSNKLFEKTLADWKSKEVGEIMSLVDVAFNKVNNILLPENFWNCLSESTFTFDENWKLYSIFPDKKILHKIIDSLTFQHSSSLTRLKTVLENIFQDTFLIQKIQLKFLDEVLILPASIIIEIYNELKDLVLIEDEEHLLKFLKNKNLNIHELEALLSSLTNIQSKEDLKDLIISTGEKLSAWKLEEIIITISPKIDIAKAGIDAFFILYPDFEEINGLVSSLKFNKTKKLLSYTITTHYKILAQIDAVDLLKLAHILRNKTVQKKAFVEIKIESESQLYDLIEELKILNLSKEVLDSNKPLSVFIAFINEDIKPETSKELLKFIYSYHGVAQCFLIKNLVYKTHVKHISVQQLFTFINSIKWTEISAILIQSFITAVEHSEKFLMIRLNEVFKTHFQVLLSPGFDSVTFKETFNIRNIVPKCNGRKHYVAELWKEKRWYYHDSVKVIKSDIVIEYCEGRPWKKEKFWNSSTNQPSVEEYEFYWCRGGYCAQRNDNLDLDKPFYTWTIIEISNVLNISLEKLTIATLTGWINRMNEIVERLYCRNCDEVLRPYPFQPNILGFYALPMFQCVNDQCYMHQKPIRFTHCLNGKCHEILDSRDCQNCCTMGLICNHCGTRCPRCVGYEAGVTVQQRW